jgi:hypothetical protein
MAALMTIAAGWLINMSSATTAAMVGLAIMSARTQERLAAVDARRLAAADAAVSHSSSAVS